ncbi:MAG: STAS domain-containing protein [Leptospirales bacterium]
MDNLSFVRIEYENISNSVVKVVYLQGKITAMNGIEINNKLKNLFEDNNYNVIVDISEIDYMDSKGMAMLLTLAKTIDQNQGKLILSKPSAFVKELLDLTNLSSFFNIASDLASARNEFS